MARPKKVVEEAVEEVVETAPSRLNSDLQEIQEELEGKK